jgi:hypothetical protein
MCKLKSGKSLLGVEHKPKNEKKNGRRPFRNKKMPS